MTGRGSGRVITLPGTRVEGWTWNLDRHRRIAAAVAAALEERRQAAGRIVDASTSRHVRRARR